ncbi:hypothetical protein ACF08M_05735 [Streptomyces sp. NPDC015032]
MPSSAANGSIPLRSDIGAFESVINNVKDAGRSAGAEVTDKVPTTSQLGG